MTYIYPAIIAVLITGAGVHLYSDHSIKDELQVQMKANSELRAQLSLQAQSIKDISVEADKRITLAQDELKKAKAESINRNKEAVKIYKTDPNNPHDLCASALELVNAQKKE